MKLFERVSYAFISAIFGAFVGVLGWWLYGQAHSLNYTGPAMHPALKHWLQGSITVFAVLGFILRERAGEVVGDTLSAVFHFEFNSEPARTARLLVAVVFIAICIAAIWHTTPHTQA